MAMFYILGMTHSLPTANPGVIHSLPTAFINDECSGYGMDHACVTEDVCYAALINLKSRLKFM